MDNSPICCSRDQMTRNKPKTWPRGHPLPSPRSPWKLLLYREFGILSGPPGGLQKLLGSKFLDMLEFNTSLRGWCQEILVLGFQDLGGGLPKIMISICIDIKCSSLGGPPPPGLGSPKPKFLGITLLGKYLTPIYPKIGSPRAFEGLREAPTNYQILYIRAIFRGFPGRVGGAPWASFVVYS